MKVLITGGAGFIGSHIVESFQGRAEVLVLDNLRSGFKHNLAGLNCTFVEGSILDRALMERVVQGADYIFHLAAFVSVPESVQKPDECREINSTGTRIVLEAAARAKVKKLIFSSSAAIYGDDPTVPKIETMPPEPKSPYATTKLEGEVLCKQFAEDGLLETVCLRYFNVFGPRQNPKSQYAAAVPIFIERALENQQIIIFGDGHQTRDFIFVKDVVAANIFFATQSTATGIFNVASGRHITVNELAAAICRLTASTSSIEYTAERPGDIKYSIASVEELHTAGFAAKYDFQKGLKATIESFKEAQP